MKIEVRYDGSSPSLCGGTLIVIIDGQEWVFPQYCLCSGGSISFDEDGEEHVEYGEWEIEEWPINFPEDLKGIVLDKVNDTIPHGCCGGCI